MPSESLILHLIEFLQPSWNQKSKQYLSFICPQYPYNACRPSLHWATQSSLNFLQLKLVCMCYWVGDFNFIFQLLSFVIYLFHLENGWPYFLLFCSVHFVCMHTCVFTVFEFRSGGIYKPLANEYLIMMI